MPPGPRSVGMGEVSPGGRSRSGVAQGRGADGPALPQAGRVPPGPRSVGVGEVSLGPRSVGVGEVSPGGG
ncbi:hypothetical protein AB0G42_30150 [Streptomyces yangpuensis]|uniref:hypothetical protein n=1 Tax=Streptomyces yangpuensis TaxID=1648182 RepID=UPI00342EE9B7